MTMRDKGAVPQSSFACTALIRRFLRRKVVTKVVTRLSLYRLITDGEQIKH